MRCLLLTGCAAAFAAALSIGAPARAADAVAEDFMVPTSDPGISLFVRNKHAPDLATFRPERTLLYVHGTSQAGEATFDLSLDGFSWMDRIAAAGYDVYLVDIRGYGRSSRPPEMNQPAEANAPVATTSVAVGDIGTAVDFILKRRKIAKLNLMGWSWGTATTGAYTASHNDKINRLVLYAPVWLSPEGTASAPADAKPLGAYATWTVEQAQANLEKGAPPDADLMPRTWFAAWKAAVLATDPVGAKMDPPVVRTPNGPPSDNRKYWRAGKPYYDPGAIKVPTLVVHGAWDGLLPSAMAHAYFDALKSTPEKRFVDIGGGTHLLMLERNRMQLFREVQLFLDE